MSTLHDNGRGGDQPDLRALIDQAGAAVVAVNALHATVYAAAGEFVGTSSDVGSALHAAAGDVREARWYATRALHSLRSLI